MKNLFIDTNVFLSFYHFSSDDLEELRKLALLVRQGELRLFLPEQILNEFYRNRASKISDAIKRLSTQVPPLQFPQLSKDYPQYEKLRDLQEEQNRLHTELLNQIEADLHSGKLKADTVLNELFAQAPALPTTSALIEKARLRIDLGNPPGKKGSLGDALIWESLLEAVPRRESLFLITDDSDYVSPLEDEELDSFLADEWARSKKSSITLFKRLSPFFRVHYPQISLTTEEEKDSLIHDLALSRSFRRTRELIGSLSAFDDFTDAQLDEIARAAANNNQIYRIISDPPIREFLTTTLKSRAPYLDEAAVTRLNQLFGEDVFDLIPF